MDIDINKYKEYQQVLKEIHAAQKKNYPTFKEMIEDLQYKAQKALEN